MGHNPVLSVLTYNSMMYSFDDIGLIPSVLSPVKSRQDVKPFIDGKLPVFVAPMTCILDSKNFDTFNKSKVIPIYPIRYDDNTRFTWDSPRWMAMTLVEFKYWFTNEHAEKEVPTGFYQILVDVANGHMAQLYTCVLEAKQHYGNKLIVMIGNIANPETYLECCRAGIDYVRVGIGGGSGCTTSCQTGFHASLPWLLQQINDYKKYAITEIAGNYYDTAGEQLLSKTKVVADGGINYIDKAIKALALGADYVMMGKCFAQCIESCGAVNTNDQTKHYYGQSSEYGQFDRFGEVKSHAEGNDSWVPITGTLRKFTDNFEATLRSAMSYAGVFELKDFIGKVRYEIQSPIEFTNYIK